MKHVMIPVHLAVDTRPRSASDRSLLKPDSDGRAEAIGKRQSRGRIGRTGYFPSDEE